MILRGWFWFGLPESWSFARAMGEADQGRKEGGGVHDLGEQGAQFFFGVVVTGAPCAKVRVWKLRLSSVLSDARFCLASVQYLSGSNSSPVAVLVLMTASPRTSTPVLREKRFFSPGVAPGMAIARDAVEHFRWAGEGHRASVR